MPGLGMTLGFKAPVRGGAAAEPDSDSLALIARMSVTPNKTRQTIIDRAVKGLKAAGVWSKLDALWMMAAHDPQAARLNWIGSSFNLQAVNSPSFLANRGYMSDGSSSYLNTQFNPATATSPKFTQNSAHLGSFCVTSTNAGFDIGIGTARLAAGSAIATCAARMNSTTQPSAPNGGSAVGHTVADRANSATMTLTKDGVQVGSGAAVSAAVGSATFFVLGYNTGATAALFTTRRVGCVHVGGSLTESERQAMADVLTTYMAAIGAI